METAMWIASSVLVIVSLLSILVRWVVLSQNDFEGD